MDITGKTALVTGANRGLGRQLAAQLRDRGARVGQAGRTASVGSMEATHTAESSPLRVSARALPWLSRRTGFWAIAFSFLPGPGAAHRRTARPLCGSRPHAPVHRLSRPPASRGGPGHRGPGGPRCHSSAAEVPPAAAQGAGERAQPVPGGRDRGVHGICCRRAVRRARGDVPGRALAPAFSRADRIDDLPGLRRRRARADHDHKLAGPPPACRRDRADDRRPVPAGRLSMDIAAQPRVVPGRRNRRRHRYWRDHSRQPDRGDRHRQPGRSGRRPGDVLHRRATPACRCPSSGSGSYCSTSVPE